MEIDSSQGDVSLALDHRVVVRMHDALGLHGYLGVHGASGLGVGVRPRPSTAPGLGVSEWSNGVLKDCMIKLSLGP